MLAYTLSAASVAGKSPFKCPDMGLLVQMIMSCKYTLPNFISDGAGSLIRSLLERSPAARLGGGGTGAAAVQAHPFYATLDWDKLMKKQIPAPTHLDLATGGEAHPERFSPTPGMYDQAAERLRTEFTPFLGVGEDIQEEEELFVGNSFTRGAEHRLSSSGDEYEVGQA